MTEHDDSQRNWPDILPGIDTVIEIAGESWAVDWDRGAICLQHPGGDLSVYCTPEWEDERDRIAIDANDWQTGFELSDWIDCKFAGLDDEAAVAAWRQAVIAFIAEHISGLDDAERKRRAAAGSS